MSDNDIKDGPESGSSPGPVEPAEAKRLAARRRFLKHGAVGSGVAVVTLYHTRGHAGGVNPVYVSSKAACNSLGGTVTNTKDILSHGKIVSRKVCDR